jgi:hypothetical protein
MYLMIVFGVLTLVPLSFGLYGVINKEKINDSSRYCMAINNLMFGCLMGIVLIFNLIYMFHWGLLSTMKKNSFYYFLMGLLAVAFFIAGLHGVINKEKINNNIFYRFSSQQFGVSIVIVIFLIAFWFKVHGHVLDLPNTP